MENDIFPLDVEIERIEKEPQLMSMVFDVAITRLAKSQPLEAKRIQAEFDNAKLLNSRLYLFGEVMGRLEALGVRSFFT